MVVVLMPGRTAIVVTANSTPATTATIPSTSRTPPYFLLTTVIPTISSIAEGGVIMRSQTHADQATRRAIRSLGDPSEHSRTFVATEGELLAGDHTGVVWQQ